MGSASLYCRSYAVAKKNYSSTIHLKIFIAFCILHETMFFAEFHMMIMFLVSDWNFSISVNILHRYRINRNKNATNMHF